MKMKKSKLVFALSIFFLNISAQDFDEKYLSSLPEDIRIDVLKKSNGATGSQQPTYRPSQFSSKLQKEEALIDLKTRLEKDLAELEKRLINDEDDLQIIADDLELFGSEFFNTISTSFMPINEPNLDSTYSLDFGDILDIQLVGQKDMINSFVVERDGSINLPEIGKITLAGLTLDKASSLISSKVKSSYIGTDVFVSLKSIRDVNILVSGNAENPGIYTMNGNSNILHAIIVAGGINEYGSYREINLLRDDNVIETLDIYDLLIDGKFNLKKRLRSGDVVFVSPRKSIASINGAVKRPFKYELKENQNLSSLINYANGLLNTADLKNIFLERVLDGSLKSIPIVNISQFDSITVNDGDLIYVRDIPYRTAKIGGAVYKPGSYIMASGETIQDLIEKAGGFTENAYPFGAVFENKTAFMTNKIAKDILYEEFLDNIIAISQQNVESNFDFAPIVQLTSEIKNFKPNGRIVVDLLSENKSSVYIREGDELIIPETTNHVYIYGEVSSEGAVLFNDGDRTVDYYVEKSGGYKKYADNQAIYILHPNGETERYLRNRNIFESEPSSSKVYPGSIIFVPRAIDNTSSRRLAAQAYVSILGNIGVALASLSALDNN
jgi:protein involved in polysaccharide export with SLBB domain